MKKRSRRRHNRPRKNESAGWDLASLLNFLRPAAPRVRPSKKPRPLKPQPRGRAALVARQKKFRPALPYRPSRPLTGRSKKVYKVS